MGLRQAKKDELRRRLYETTVESFRERGFAGTRIKDIIDRVGVSEATFFNYFPTKEAVLQQSSAETKRWYGVFLQHLAARDDEPVAERLRELTRVIASVCAADRECSRPLGVCRRRLPHSGICASRALAAGDCRADLRE